MGRDFLDGGAGDDYLIGGHGTDYIYLSSGRDVGYGGNEDDFLVSLDGGDILSGGLGMNVFSIYDTSLNGDTIITDFFIEGSPTNHISIDCDYFEEHIYAGQLEDCNQGEDTYLYVSVIQDVVAFSVNGEVCAVFDGICTGPR